MSLPPPLNSGSRHLPCAGPTRWIPAITCALLALGMAFTMARAQSDAPITEAAKILALPTDTAARHLPVSLKGVVTAAEPDWEGRFFVHDATGGIFVVGTDRQPQVGDAVEVTGVTSRGAFAPIVSAARWQTNGTAALPPPRTTTIERLMAGIEDGQRVEFVGTVRSVYMVPLRKLAMDVAVNGRRLHVFPKLPARQNPESIVGAKVRVRGTAAASFNASVRRLTSINVYVPTAEDFTIEEPDSAAPFSEPVLPLGEIARYRPDINRGGRIHVRGVVTLFRPGLDLFIQDGTGGVHVETAQLLRVEVGDTLDAVGFLDIAGFQPVLEDARCRRIEVPPVPVKPQEVAFPQLRQGSHGNELIVLRGRLVGCSERPIRRDGSGFVGVRTICTIQTADFTFTAECEHNAENNVLSGIVPGSIVAATGVASIETGDDGRLNTLSLLQRTPEDMTVLETPSWFTQQRLVLAIIGLLLVALAGIAWSVTVSKKNAMLSFLVADREKAHDELERRVRERSEQLQVEMTARKSAEVEFKAVLAERTRLARDLHDTLEQALTGIALQLDTTAKLLHRSPADAERHLEQARGFMQQSQLELRRSIWDLRSRELEEFDVAKALLHTSRQIAQGTPLKVNLEIDGPPRPLPEVVEENLLRIGQEAMTNIVKHSGATEATLRLSFAREHVTLSIRDNGSGFRADRISTSSDKHFGLLGMAERSKRLAGRFSVVGAPGEGTTVSVSIPSAPATTPHLQPA